jgi:hypothetical protein
MSKQVTKHTTTRHTEPTVKEAVGKTEVFFQKHKNHLFYGIAAVIFLVCAWLAYQKFYNEPLKQEALGQMFLAEQAFRADNFEMALYGDGNILGFTQIRDEYGSKAGIALHFYMGVSYLHLGEYQAAIDALHKYSSKDFVMQARAFCNIGDAYVGLDNLAKAQEFYLKAARHNDNILVATYLKKAAIIAEELNQIDKAIALYQELKDKYPQTMEGYEADKYISRLQVNK